MTQTRGCGSRKAGGIYMECKTGPGGRPVTDFVFDPPPVDLAEWAVASGLTAVGVRILEFQGAHHVFDIVGVEHYASPADFVEEVAVLGASRRLARTLDFSKLEPGKSRMILLHRHAYIENFADYYAALAHHKQQDPWCWICKRPAAPHMWDVPESPPNEMCVGLWWHDLEEGQARERHVAPRMGLHGRREQTGLSGVEVRLPSSSVVGWQRPEDAQPVYRLAAFMSLPIHNLAVIRGNHREEDAALEALKQSRMAVEVCDD